MRTTQSKFFFVLIFLGFAYCSPSSAQVVTGTPPFGSFGGGPDQINLANLNAHLMIPVLDKAGRGLRFTFDLSYDSSVWVPVTSSGTKSWQNSTATTWGWTTSIPKGGRVSYSLYITRTTCYDGKIQGTQTT
jgi:hypothetical protein